jgi:type III restriction enzyme
MLAVILDREADRWFRPVAGQFQIRYRRGADMPEYVPDFVAETKDRILMLEPKSTKELDDAEVQAKAKAAEEWCHHASGYARSVGGKQWTYALLPHDLIHEGMSIKGLLAGAHAPSPLAVMA